MQANTLSGGFTNPATQSAHAFRSVMEAMARPGTFKTSKVRSRRLHCRLRRELSY